MPVQGRVLLLLRARRPPTNHRPERLIHIPFLQFRILHV